MRKNHSMLLQHHHLQHLLHHFPSVLDPATKSTYSRRLHLPRRLSPLPRATRLPRICSLFSSLRSCSLVLKCHCQHFPWIIVDRHRIIWSPGAPALLTCKSPSFSLQILDSSGDHECDEIKSDRFSLAYHLGFVKQGG